MFTILPNRKLIKTRQDLYLCNNLSKKESRYIMYGLCEYGKRKLSKKIEYLYKYIKLDDESNAETIIKAPIKESMRWAKELARRNDAYVTSEILKPLMDELLQELNAKGVNNESSNNR